MFLGGKMLEQFLNTSFEIDTLLADKLLSEQYKAKLRPLVGQPASIEGLAARNKVLDEINNILAHDAIVASDCISLFAKNLRLTRISSVLFEFINTNQATLENIFLSGNNLVTLPFNLLRTLKLKKCELSHNYLDQETIDNFSSNFSYPVKITPQKLRISSTKSDYTPYRNSQSDNSGIVVGQQIKNNVETLMLTPNKRETEGCSIQ